jgi:5'-deoxynucleotidase YfbR-like HD superfamily hydrolase
MKALYLSATGSKKTCKEIIEDFNPNGVAESYKEFLNVFYLIAQYNIAENFEKKKLIAKYSNLAEKLSYPLFDEEYIRKYNLKD